MRTELNNYQNNLPLLSLDKVSFSWPCGNKALDKCSFFIPRPGLWMLVGSNGSGKSTLFRLISGMIQAQSGGFLCNLKPALMFQNPDHQLLLPSVESDVLLSLPKTLTYRESRECVKTALNQVGMVHLASRPIHTLSGGQKQRVALAGALASQANLLLLDEPTALLDPDSQKMVIETVKGLSQRIENPITVLWITHRLEELDHSDGAVRMESGRLSAWNSGSELQKQLNPLAGRRV